MSGKEKKIINYKFAIYYSIDRLSKRFFIVPGHK